VVVEVIMEEVIGKLLLIFILDLIEKSFSKIILNYHKNNKSGGDVALGMIAGAAIGGSLGWGWGHHHGKI
jgi:hypothetical protein